MEFVSRFKIGPYLVPQYGLLSTLDVIDPALKQNGGICQFGVLRLQYLTPMFKNGPVLMWTGCIT